MQEHQCNNFTQSAIINFRTQSQGLDYLHLKKKNSIFVTGQGWKKTKIMVRLHQCIYFIAVHAQTIVGVA